MAKYFAALCVAAVCLLPPIACRADTQVGIEGLVLSGMHDEPHSRVNGTGGGLFLQLDQRWRGMQLHFEGIPSVATARVNSPYGPVTASLGVFGATARFRLDPLGRLWAGLGTQVLEQKTPIVNIRRFDASRLAGSRFELVGQVPLAARRFVEAHVAVMPHLSGVVRQTTQLAPDVVFLAQGPETASMIDFGAGYGIRQGKLEYVVGLRSINFAARFSDGREADRNVGIGMTAEVRVDI